MKINHANPTLSLPLSRLTTGCAWEPPQGEIWRMNQPKKYKNWHLISELALKVWGSSSRVRRSSNRVLRCSKRGCGVAQKECGVAQILVRRLAARQARFDSRLGTSLKIHFLSSSGEDIGVGLNDSDLYVINCMSQLIKKIQVNKKTRVASSH